jgi:AmiR/NasT family two-component response regulator
MPDRQLVRLRAALGRDPMLQARRSLDLAQGILIGLRRCTTEAAFDELVTVAHKHAVSVSAVASALVTLTTGTGDEPDSDRDALAVAHLAWRDLLDG